MSNHAHPTVVGWVESCDPFYFRFFLGVYSHGILHYCAEGQHDAVLCAPGPGGYLRTITSMLRRLYYYDEYDGRTRVMVKRRRRRVRRRIDDDDQHGRLTRVMMGRRRGGGDGDFQGTSQMLYTFVMLQLFAANVTCLFIDARSMNDRRYDS
ncbi:hypothetical protein DFP72DRAFT_911809 [Ephemerocybe angulata]|uniref:Uncharacterized protein n=1 Tax=Ephemerocybe angulata TaxID=980116 RepID=A0A8H6M1H4_9AGAR|nr:hypothetical protein DFP72DRAFT_911809 [Tulosesus angulatus]